MKLWFLFYVFFSALFSESLGSALGGVIDIPTYGKSKVSSKTCDEIIEIATPILQNRLVAMQYDRLMQAEQFIEHYHKCEKINHSIKPLDAFKTFRFNPLPKNMTGGACVSQTYDLYCHLPKELDAYIVSATLPMRFRQFAFPLVVHTAVVIRFDGGIVLLDPSFDLDVPVVLREGDELVFPTKSKGTWVFTFDGKNIVCKVPEKKPLPNGSNHSLLIYSIDRLLNPIESSVHPMILTDRRYSLLSRRSDGSHRVHMNIELDKGRVIWDVGGKTEDPVSFAAIESGLFVFPEWFASELSVTGLSLTERVIYILRNKKILDELYIDYLNFLKKCDDWSITGPIQISAIDDKVRSLKE